MTAPAGNRWTCEHCSVSFARHKSGSRPIRFCGSGCYYAHVRDQKGNSGSFKRGHASWNKGMKGLHQSPATEWKKGQTSTRRVPVGTVRVRLRKRDGHPRAFIKVAEPNCWKPRAVWVWEQANGPVPRGHVVHHDDRDALNDELTNLILMTRAEHALEHSNELHQERWGKS